MNNNSNFKNKIEHIKQKSNFCWASEQLKVYSEYKFVIAFENKGKKGYVTEKIVQALQAGAVPIYWGAPDVADYINPECFIHMRDFPSFSSLFNFVKKVDENDILFDVYKQAPMLLPTSKFYEYTEKKFIQNIKVKDSINAILSPHYQPVNRKKDWGGVIRRYYYYYYYYCRRIWSFFVQYFIALRLQSNTTRFVQQKYFRINITYCTKVYERIKGIFEKYNTNDCYIHDIKVIPPSGKTSIHSSYLMLALQTIFYPKGIFLKTGYQYFLQQKHIKKIFWKMLPNYFCKKIYTRGYLFPFLRKINRKKSIHFAIVTDGIKGKNILNFPYFFHFLLGCFECLIKTTKQHLSKKKKFCAFVVSNGDNEERGIFFEKLSKYKKVDSYGSFLKNTSLPADLVKKHSYSGECLKLKSYSENKKKIDIFALNQDLFRDYKFVICFENTYTEDYITEKLINVMIGNSIAIYKGAPNISEFFNTDSFINWDDYGSDKAVIEKVIALDKDDAAYNQMLNEPFFKDNKLPPRIANAEKDLEKFIVERVLGKKIAQ